MAGADQARIAQARQAAAAALASGQFPPRSDDLDSEAQALADRPLAEAVVGLMREPLRLSELRRRFPWLLQGHESPEVRRVVAAVLAADPEPAVRARITAPVRSWALQPAGWFRRTLTLLFDVPVMFALILVPAWATLEGGLLPAGSQARDLAVLGFFLMATVGYVILSEWLLGATVGGLICGVRVVEADGRGMGPGWIFFRWLGKALFVLTIFFAARAGTVNSAMRGTRSALSLADLHDSPVVLA